jgi:glycosyltransferase involved in cell wall biosynthesis
MNIVYDGHIFRWQKTGGVSRYFSEVISRLPADWLPVVLGAGDRNGSLPSHPRLGMSRLSSVRPRRFSQPLKKAWWKFRYVRRADVFHPTFYNLTGGLRFSEIRCPVVLTVHDFIKAKHPQLEGDSAEAVARQREAILHAAHLICISKGTEQDLLEFHPPAAGKTSVIYHGSSFPVCHEPQSDSIFETPTFLFVGRRATYKNFQMLLRAFAKACQSHPGIRLHLAGPPLDDEERWQIHFLGLAARISDSIFPDEPALQQLYRNSVALLYPSRHEGFGIPPLEAMACGTVAVTANTSCLPEVVGGAGIMLDPADENAWAECVLQIAAQKIDRRNLVEQGRQRVQTLTWEKSAARHVEVYKQFA